MALFWHEMAVNGNGNGCKIMKKVPVDVWSHSPFLEMPFVIATVGSTALGNPHGLHGRTPPGLTACCEVGAISPTLSVAESRAASASCSARGA